MVIPLAMSIFLVYSLRTPTCSCYLLFLLSISVIYYPAVGWKPQKHLCMCGRAFVVFSLELNRWLLPLCKHIWHRHYRPHFSTQYELYDLLWWISPFRTGIFTVSKIVNQRTDLWPLISVVHQIWSGYRMKTSRLNICLLKF